MNEGRKAPAGGGRGEVDDSSGAAVSSTSKWTSKFADSPLRLSIIVLLAIFLGEGAIIFYLHKFASPMTPAWEGLVDAAVLIALALPLLYFFYHQPMKKNLVALETSEKKIRAITQASNAAIIQINGKGKITFWNNAAERIFGYSEDEACGRDIRSFLVPEQNHEAAAKGLARFAQTGEGPHIGRRYQVVAKRKDGGEFPALASASVFDNHTNSHPHERNCMVALYILSFPRRFIPFLASKANASKDKNDISHLWHNINRNTRVISHNSYGGWHIKCPIEY